MNKLSTVIAATLLIAAGAASADATPLTREQVVAELVAARSSGELAVLQGEKGVEAGPTVQAAGSKLPRQAMLVKRAEKRTVEQVVVGQGENAARELGDFPASDARRSTTLAGR